MPQGSAQRWQISPGVTADNRDKSATVPLMTKQVLVVASAALLLSACGGGDDRVTAASVAEKCDSDSSYLELSSDNKAIEYNFKPGTESTEAIYNCLLKETGAPSSVDYRFMETRPIDGTQTATWEGWELNWTYEGKYEGTRMHLSEV